LTDEQRGILPKDALEAVVYDQQAKEIYQRGLEEINLL